MFIEKCTALLVFGRFGNPTRSFKMYVYDFYTGHTHNRQSEKKSILPYSGT